jgi:hypothetical protein
MGHAIRRIAPVSAPPAAPVYCGDCHFFRRSGPRRAATCLHPHAWVLVRNFKGVQSERVAPEVRNADNACSDYLRARWSHEEQRCSFFFTLVCGLLAVGAWHPHPVLASVGVVGCCIGATYSLVRLLQRLRGASHGTSGDPGAA